jgi:hypothetical protein
MNRPLLSRTLSIGTLAFGWVILSTTSPLKIATAADLAIPVPELADDYLSSSGQPLSNNFRQVTVELGMELSEIHSAELRLSGSLTYGVYGDLNFPGEFPLTADIFSWVDDNSGSVAVFFERLLSSDGTFDITLPYDRQHQPAVSEDFSSWLDGYAELQFQVTTPIMIATTYLIALPELSIHSATLLISGQQQTATPEPSTLATALLACVCMHYRWLRPRYFPRCSTRIQT